MVHDGLSSESRLPVGKTRRQIYRPIQHYSGVPILHQSGPLHLEKLAK